MTGAKRLGANRGLEKVMSENPLVGTWRLVRWYLSSEAGDEVQPLGENATGFICYSPDGFVFVHIMAAKRAFYAEDDPLSGTPEEDSAAIKSYLSYAGPYEYHGDRVVHRVTQSSFPNWVGSDQVRKVRLEDDTLELSVEGAYFQGSVVTTTSLWKRASLD